ncbi:MAG: cytochrome C oxidase subunit II [Candidatus Eremiobacteraeota bacterium]|nr:cytochrome C oxidase subunit II [Candidatus Eremiobacteraeota bacterium]
MGSGDLVLKIFLVVAAVAIGSMVLLANVGARSPISQEAVSARGYALRRYWFWVLLVGAVLTFTLTISHFPYPSAHASMTDQHITVVAEQYSFKLPSTIARNRPIIFDVTSKDVNHGFAIYAPDGTLFSQVQAMPDYVNHLPITFTVPGHYTLRCLEYCGIAHASMQGGFDVR